MFSSQSKASYPSTTPMIVLNIAEDSLMKVNDIGQGTPRLCVYVDKKKSIF